MASAKKKSASGVPKITLAELNERLADIDSDDADIIPYLAPDHERSAGFRIALRPNPQTVELTPMETARVRAGGMMNWANGVERWRRRQRFDRRLEHAPNDPILVSEGDSWFQFPFFLKDVIDQLNNKYNVLSTCAAGDTVKNMLGPAPEYLQSLRELKASGKKVRALLFSGGGNDFADVLAGKGDDPPILNEFQQGKDAAWHITTAAYQAKTKFVTDTLKAFLKQVNAEFPGLPIILHGYDYAIPALAQGDPRNPSWTKLDAWLAGPMKKRKITAANLHAGIMRKLIDDHNANIKAIATGAQNAHYIDLRGTMNPLTMWADELHPTDDGFAAVAAKFRVLFTQLGI